MPHWARGVFSVRFGGSEFKGPNPASTDGHAVPDLSTAASTPEGEPVNGAPRPTFMECPLMPLLKECVQFKIFTFNRTLDASNDLNESCMYKSPVDVVATLTP